MARSLGGAVAIGLVMVAIELVVVAIELAPCGVARGAVLGGLVAIVGALAAGATGRAGNSICAASISSATSIGASSPTCFAGGCITDEDAGCRAAQAIATACTAMAQTAATNVRTPI